MIIHAPAIGTDSEEITVSAGIEFENPIPDTPDELWVKFPLSQKDWVTDRADGFLTSMLLLAMQQGEDVQVRGPVSPRLLSGIEEYQRVFNMWFPKRFKLIDIACEPISRIETGAGEDTVISAFSGGVDSFFSLWSHLPENDPNSRTRITHTLFVHGFDIKLEREEVFSVLRDSYRNMFEELRIDLLTARTNVQHFGTRSNWGIFHGTALIGLAHILDPGSARFYVPASHTYNHLVPWGSDPRIDHLLSTETTEIIHDGAGYSRVEKTEAISHWPATYDRLRVCAPGDSAGNCSRCEKCLRTMVTLDMLDALQKYSVFSLPINKESVRKCRYFNESDFAYPREIIERARTKKRWDLVFDLSYAVVRSRIFQAMRFLRIRLQAAARAGPVRDPGQSSP